MSHRLAPLLAAALLSVTACGSAMPPTAPDAMLVDVTTLPMAGAGVSGRWAGVGHAATGSVRVSVQGGVARVDFSSDFSVSPVPAPYVYLNTTNNPNSGRPLRVAVLASNSGAQSYAFQLPAGTAYTWVLVWCDRYNVAVAEAPIPATP